MINGRPEKKGHRPGDGARRKARRRAAEFLYESDLREWSHEKIQQQLEQRSSVRQSDEDEYLEGAGRATRERPPLQGYALELINGVLEHREEIDEVLSTYSEGWELKRMPVMDRVLLRMGAFEVMSRSDVPDPVAIDEAVTLASQFSTDDSPRFINGVLGRIQTYRDLTA